MVPLAGTSTDAASDRALSTLRHRVIPRTVGSVPGVDAAVTGETAGIAGLQRRDEGPRAARVGFVLGLAFLLLLVTFRSVVIPLTAIALNLLSVGAAYGVLVLVFQRGHRESLLDFESRRRDVVAAPVPVRDPVRPLDGLPRVDPQPHPRGP